MAQLYAQILAPPHGWIVGGPETATQILLLQPATVTYTDGTHDTLPALTPAVVQATGALTVDRTAAVWCPYTVKGSGVLSIIKESGLGTLTSSYAVLGRVTLHEVQPYPPDPYLASVTAPATVLGGYTYARQVTVTAGDAVSGSTAAATVAGTDYVVHLVVTGTDAATIYSGLIDQTSGSDLAVLDTTGSTPVALDLDLVSVTSARVEVWFKLRRALAASGTDSGYALAWGNASPTPQRTLANIYNLVDDFTTWRGDLWGAQPAGVTLAGGICTLSASGAQKIRFPSVATFGQGYAFVMRAQFTAQPTGCNQEAGFATNEDTAPNFLLRNLGSDWGVQSYDGSTYHETDLGAQPGGYAAYSLGRAPGGAVYAWEESGAPASCAAATASTAVPAFVQCVSGQGGGSVQSYSFNVDWVKVRPYVAHEPTVALGAQIAAPGTEGSIQYVHGGVLTLLPIGTAGQKLTVVNGVPAWV